MAVSRFDDAGILSLQSYCKHSFLHYGPRHLIFSPRNADCVMHVQLYACFNCIELYAEEGETDLAARYVARIIIQPYIAVPV
jgi:hypothetical protein